MKRASTFWRNVRIVTDLAPHPRRWPMVARMGLAWLRVAMLDQRPFRFFDVALNYGCNLSCEHCSALPMMQRGRPTLTHDDYRRFVDEAMDVGAMVFHFTGGEPLMRKDLFDIIRIFKPSWNMLSVQTNGLLLTDEKADRLRDAGVRMIGVSLDSADATVHDAFRRREGCHVAALAAIDRAVQRGFTCAVSVCVSHQNVRSPDLHRIIELIGERGVQGFFNLAVPIGHWAGRWDVMITPEDRAYIDELIARYPFMRTDFQSNWCEYGCPAMKEKAYLTPYGDVIPCPFIQVSYGNITNEPLRDIIKRGQSSPELEGYPPRCLASQDVHFVKSFRCYQPDCTALPVPREEALVTNDTPPVACSKCAPPELHAACPTR